MLDVIAILDRRHWHWLLQKCSRHGCLPRHRVDMLRQKHGGRGWCRVSGDIVADNTTASDFGTRSGGCVGAVRTLSESWQPEALSVACSVASEVAAGASPWPEASPPHKPSRSCRASTVVSKCRLKRFEENGRLPGALIIFSSGRFSPHDFVRRNLEPR